MAHKFNPKNYEKLDNEKRRKELPPHETLVELSLQKGDIALDIGCGIGYFTIPMAKITKEKVYAVDISEEMLEKLLEVIDGIDINITTIKSDEYQSKIDDNSVNYIFLSNIFHEVEDKDKFLNNYLKKLKKDGKVVFIEWKKVKTQSGPPLKERISKDELKEILEQHDLKFFKYVDLNDTHYGLVMKY